MSSDDFLINGRSTATHGFFFFFQAEDGIRDIGVTGVQTCALPILLRQRSCHAAPVWLSSQRSSVVSPRIRLLSVPAFARTNGGLVTCVQISSLLRQVAGQFRASARAGKRARADSRMLFCLGGQVAGVVTAATVTILPSRTQRSWSPVGSQGRERV